eukprot:CAMPEP_0202450958 /NCGR_PEP_ID=MMETSP1360-20130828/9490_1 /ASSEMBLY_ACC=CAM_ASM_000848 /TAXON_ID=515479 /ORGANISM="Licmophora paradoxa, Strain CCMP2313" /LENGTH=106 /DNA_ID=CAMNT_0049069407 /DNA_START=211 /DNA_END=528 /DNA_ORIENTATION=+
MQHCPISSLPLEQQNNPDHGDRIHKDHILEDKNEFRQLMKDNSRPMEEKSESGNRKRHATPTPHNHQQQKQKQPSEIHSSCPSTSVSPSMAINIKMKEDRPESASF